MRTARTGSTLGWPRTIAIALALVFAAMTVWGFATDLRQVPAVDFVSFWSAGRLVLQGHAATAYDVTIQRNLELTVLPRMGFLPFAYPPPFLAVVTPFALMPAGIALVAWVVITCGCFLLIARRVAALEYVLANPVMLVDSFIGQTGFLTGAAFILGLSMLSATPIAGGAVLGLLVMKPQLALMLPFAMVAGREWRAIAGAVGSSFALLLLGWLMFGSAAYVGFYENVIRFGGYMRESRWNWAELASGFAFARHLGLSTGVSLFVQALIAAAAAVATWIAWSRNWEEKVSVVAAASLLASPYLLTYDAVLLIVPAGCLIARRQYWSIALLWLLCALPVLQVFDFYPGPNTIPIAALLAIGMVAAPHFPRSSARGGEKSRVTCAAE